MPFYIAIIDYEMGNLKSVNKCLKHLNVEALITDDKKEILEADGVILPGVGAFGDAMKQLKKKDLISVINQVVKEKKPLFGICLGHQLIFSKSYEMGYHKGLNLVKGEVIQFDISKVDKIPQIGWNNVEFLKRENFLIQGIPNNSYFYFVHSFYAIPENKEQIIGLTKYGEIEYCSIICNKNVFATQFHPEKSSKYGIMMYQNFVNFCKK
ncbi:MAG: imidazole glycerol phosphate synthase subunit HisH [Candidatus Thorarchaeota archaeon]